MSTSQNIFERFSMRNQEDNFSNVLPEPSTPEEQSVNETDNIIDTTEKEGNIFERMASKEIEKEKNEYSVFDTLIDVGQQVISKGISGLGGAYGNILDTFGLQPKSGDLSQRQEEVYSTQSDILDKINRGEPPTFSELMMLSDDENLSPVSRLPTSKEIEKGVEKFTGIGEGKTSSGRIAGRGAEFLGEGVATGGGARSLIGLGASGVAGQSIREAGGPEWAASGTEIAGSIAPSLVSSRLIPTGREARDVVRSGRGIGLSEAQITPLIQGDRKVATLSRVARKGSRTRELFREIRESLGDSYNTIRRSRDAQTRLPNADQIDLIREFGTIRNELSRTLAPSPDKEAALRYIEQSIGTLRDVNITPEHLVNFWQDINRSVNWNSISGGRRALTRMKNPISNVLERVSPQLANDFEMTNDLYSRYAQISRALRPDIIDSIVNKGEILAAPATGIALVTGNPWPLVSLGLESSVRLLGREMLINPYFQNISKKLVTNFNQSSMKGVTELVNQVKEYMERKHPKEDWSFLTDDRNYQDDED